MLLSRKLVICASSAPNKKSPIAVAKRHFEKKRFVTLKENFNKLVAIATADMKELQEFVVQLDELHKKEMNYKSGGVEPEADAEETFFDK